MAKREPHSTSTEIVPISADRGESPVARAILEFVSRIPQSDVPRASGGSVEDECRRLASAAANKAGLTAGSLALPPGPLGWLTVLPELVAIWRIQGQLVSDIAAAYGKTPKLGREQMLWCLFRHTAAQAFRDVAIRVGDRLVFRNAATSVLQRVAGRIGVSVSKRAVGKGISRWLPIVGALGVGAYAYYDTGQVAKTAIELFSGEVHIEDGDDPDDNGRGKKAVRSKVSGDESATASVHAKTADAPANKAPKARRQTRAGAASARAAPKKAPRARASATSAGESDKAGGAPKARRPATKATKPASRKRAVAKTSVARKVATAKVAKTATKKVARKVTARRAPIKKTTGRKTKRAT